MDEKDNKTLLVSESMPVPENIFREDNNIASEKDFADKSALREGCSGIGKVSHSVEQILKQRAEELSEEVDESSDDEEFINIVEFRLNDEIFAIDALYTKQVGTIKNLTTIPCTPEYVLGVTGMQEQIISVIDIRTFFQMQSTKTTHTKKIIVLEKKDMCFAIAADDVIGIKKVYLKTVQKTIDTFDDVRKKYFYGLTGDQTIILDGGKILTDQDIIVG